MRNHHFRTARFALYIAESWCVPLIVGVVIGVGLCLWELTTSAGLLDDALSAAIATCQGNAK